MDLSATLQPRPLFNFPALSHGGQIPVVLIQKVSKNQEKTKLQLTGKTLPAVFSAPRVRICLSLKSYLLGVL
jgi:hypothetical protein